MVLLIYSFIFKNQSSRDQNKYKNQYTKMLSETYLLSYNFLPDETK